jgi:hypothetical protein
VVIGSYDRDREKLQSSLESILSNVEKQKIKTLISQEETIKK